MERVNVSKTAETCDVAKNWLNDAYILDMDYFVKNLSGIKAKGVRPDVVGSIIAHYASKWVPELSESKDAFQVVMGSKTKESATTLWKKKRFFVETLVSILPLEHDAVSCNFLLRLLRVANMVGVEPAYREELEKRVSWQLHKAKLKELMIPSFSHTCATLLDVELVKRLVRRFLGLDEGVRTGVALLKVAKLLDSYLAETAMDPKLSMVDFVELASVLPPHARSMDDGLYHAIDTYLKAHPGVTKKEKKLMWELINHRKLTPEAAVHVTQNELLPVRAVIQMLFYEQNKINRQLEGSGSLAGLNNTNILDLSSRCLSKREMSAQQEELKRLKDDVMSLQKQINALHTQLERLLEKKGGLFKWGSFTLLSSFRGGNETRTTQGIGEKDFGEVGFGRYTPIQGDHAKTKLLKGRKWRRSSMS